MINPKASPRFSRGTSLPVVVYYHRATSRAVYALIELCSIERPLSALQCRFFTNAWVKIHGWKDINIRLSRATDIFLNHQCCLVRSSVASIFRIWLSLQWTCLYDWCIFFNNVYDVCFFSQMFDLKYWMHTHAKCRIKTPYHHISTSIKCSRSSLYSILSEK